MNTNPVDWSSFDTEIEVFQILHENFEDVSPSHIHRNRNGRANALAKKARIKDYIFFHINQIRIDVIAPRKIG